MATTQRITSKRQITIRKDYLDRLGVHPGEKIEMALTPDGRKLVITPAAQPADIRRFFGMLKREGQTPKTLEEIENGIGQGAAEEFRRGIGQTSE